MSRRRSGLVASLASLVSLVALASLNAGCSSRAQPPQAAPPSPPTTAAASSDAPLAAPLARRERTPVTTTASDAAAPALRLVANLTGPYGTHVAFDREGKHWALADQHSIQLGSDGTLGSKVSGAAEPILDLAWSRDERELLAGPERYDLERGRWSETPALRQAMDRALTFGLADPPSPEQLAVVAAAASPDGQDLVISARFSPTRELGKTDRYKGPNERLLVLAAGDRSPRGVLWEGSSEMRALAVSDELIAAGGTAVSVWDRKTLQKIIELPHKLVARALAFSSAGDRLAVITAAGEVTVWDPRTGDKISSFQAHQIDGYTVAFHPTKPLLATGGQDGKLRLWSLEGRPVYEELLGGWVQAVAFAPNGKKLAATTWSRPPHLVIYDVR